VAPGDLPLRHSMAFLPGKRRGEAEISLSMKYRSETKDGEIKKLWTVRYADYLNLPETVTCIDSEQFTMLIERGKHTDAWDRADAELYGLNAALFHSRLEVVTEKQWKLTVMSLPSIRDTGLISLGARFSIR